MTHTQPEPCFLICLLLWDRLDAPYKIQTEHETALVEFSLLSVRD